MSKDKYTISVKCFNCGVTDVVDIIKGDSVVTVSCSNCECHALGLDNE